MYTKYRYILQYTHSHLYKYIYIYIYIYICIHIHVTYAYVYIYIYIAKCKTWIVTTHVGGWSSTNRQKDFHTTINHAWIPILG